MIVILTALEVEYRAMSEHLAELRPHRHAAGTQFDVGVVAGHPDRPVALGLTGTGNTTAAIMAERAINEFDPDAVVFVGVAGALREWLAIGDVVVATRVYGYHGERSEEDGSRIRPRGYEAGHALEQAARRLARSADWRADLADDGCPPQVHFEPIASGEVVLNSRNSPTAHRLDQYFNDAVAVETEGAGVAQCGHLHGGLPTITVRGISDHADGQKDSLDRNGSQTIAARHAALFARALIVAVDGMSGPASREPKRETPPGMIVHNEVHGSHNNTIQAGVIHGDLHFGRGTT
jgi:nucleoside phosphorylase